MFIKFSEFQNNIRSRLFPSRQFIYNIGNDTKVLQLGTSHQFNLASGLLAIIALTLIQSYNVFISSAAPTVNPEQAIKIAAEYDRAITDSNAQYETTIAHLIKRQAAFDSVQTRLKEKQDVLELLEQYGYLDGVSINTNKSAQKTAS